MPPILLHKVPSNCRVSSHVKKFKSLPLSETYDFRKDQSVSIKRSKTTKLADDRWHEMTNSFLTFYFPPLECQSECEVGEGVFVLVLALEFAAVMGRYFAYRIMQWAYQDETLTSALNRGNSGLCNT